MLGLDLIAQPSTLSAGAASDRRAQDGQELVNQLRTTFTERDALYELFERTVHNEVPVKIPEAYQKTATEVYSPLAGHIVNTITAALSVNGQKVQFTPTGIGTGPSENATKREIFFEASWQRQERESRRRLLRAFMYSLVLKGEGILKTVERSKTAWSGYHEFSAKTLEKLARDNTLDQDGKDRYYNAKTEEYKRLHAPYPIRTTDVLPETFYYLRGEDGFNACVEVKDVPYMDTLERFKMGLNSRGEVCPAAMGLPLPEWQSVMRGMGSNIKMHEIWTANEANYVLLGPGQWKGSQGNSRQFGRGTVVRTIKNHGYGDPMTQTLIGPYFQALGTTTANRLPHKAGLGVLYGFLDLFKLLNNMLTIAQQNAVLTGFASFKKKRPPSEQAIRPRDPRALNPYGEDGDEDDEDDEVIEPGYIYPDDIDPLEMPRAGIDFEKFINMIRGFMELALPAVVQGVVSGEQSGYALNQANHLARLAWSPILDNAQFALSDRVGFESRLIEKHIGETVYAHGSQPMKGTGRGRVGTVLSLGPKDTGGHHIYDVTLDPQTPSNKQLELSYHDTAVKAGFESEADAIEALGGSPDQVVKQRMFEAFNKHPKVQERIFERAMQKLGWVDAQEVIRTQEELALAGQNGDPMTPDGQEAAPGVEGVFAPGVNMPATPTPQGSVTGAGPPGSLPGRPMTPASLPAAHEPLPGQA